MGVARLAGRPVQKVLNREKGGGLTGGVLEDNTEDSDGTVGVGYIGGTDHSRASLVGGHGGINISCTGRGVWLNVRKYSSSCQVRSSTVDVIRCTPVIWRGFGEWT